MEAKIENQLESSLVFILYIYIFFFLILENFNL